MNYPTPLNPAILLYAGTIPAMKNSMQVRQSKKTKQILGIGRKKSVRLTMVKLAQKAKQQWDSQGFDLINENYCVGAFVHLGVYIASTSKSGLPNSDLDNSYTTLQETWQKSIIDNDRQIVDFHVTRRKFSNKNIPEYSMIFLWSLEKEKLDADPLYSITAFQTFINDFYSKKTILELFDYARRKST